MGFFVQCVAGLVRHRCVRAARGGTGCTSHSAGERPSQQQADKAKNSAGLPPPSNPSDLPAGADAGGQAVL